MKWVKTSASDQINLAGRRKRPSNPCKAYYFEKLAGLPITAEAVIRVTENQNNDDFNLISDAYILTSVIPAVVNEYESTGMPVSKAEIYQHRQAKFIKIYAGSNNGNEDMKFLQYFTGYDNQYITIKLQTNAAVISSEDEATLQQIIDCVTFSSLPQ